MHAEKHKRILQACVKQRHSINYTGIILAFDQKNKFVISKHIINIHLIIFAQNFKNILYVLDS
jgi:hypothetical protein